jgi:hypothetical protein
MCRILMLVSVFIWEYLEFIERSLGGISAGLCFYFGLYFGQLVCCLGCFYLELR